MSSCAMASLSFTLNKNSSMVFFPFCPETRMSHPWVEILSFVFIFVRLFLFVPVSYQYHLTHVFSRCHTASYFRAVVDHDNVITSKTTRIAKEGTHTHTHVISRCVQKTCRNFQKLAADDADLAYDRKMRTANISNRWAYRRCYTSLTLLIEQRTFGWFLSYLSPSVALGTYRFPALMTHGR